MENKILALVLARKGSTRLKNKNILKIKNKPLIQWTFEKLYKKKIRKLFTDVLVSTDSKKIINLAKKYNFLTPWLRPKKFSTKFSSSELSALHALKWYENNIETLDGLFLFQPTSPFRNDKKIILAIKIFSIFFFSLFIFNKIKVSSNKNIYKKSKLIKLGFKLTSSNIVNYIYDYSDKYFIKIFLGPASVSLYSIPQQIMGKITTISKAMSAVLLPDMSEYKSNNLFNYSLNFFIFFISPIIFFFFDYYDWAIKLWVNNNSTDEMTDLLLDIRLHIMLDQESSKELSS
jgi:CMP-N-acetylneuraminic acid synthetase